MEIVVQPTFQHVTWKIRNFLELPQEDDFYVDSPEFLFGGDSYCLRLFPRMKRTEDTAFHVRRLSAFFPQRKVSCKIDCVRRDADGEESCDYEEVSLEENYFLRRSGIENMRDVYVPDGIFTVLCCMRLSAEARAGSSAQGEEECFPGIHKLQSDYRQLLQKGTESDACVVVRGKEFPVHRNVLRARSTVFEAMFGHDTAEKESGRVVIDDLDPVSFGDFLDYLYTGDVQAGLSDDNAFGLYTAADKYDVATLKALCVEYMRRTLSVDSFCDVMTLALRHCEEELLQQAIQFFKDNLQRIIITAKWQQFVLDNGTAANELFIKALVPGSTISDH